MWHFDGCLRLSRSRLALDARQRQAWGYVSHAHADHMARHEWALATPATGRLYRHRLGPKLRVRELPYRQAMTHGDCQLTTFPAGHCLGSSLLLADDGKTRLLYTGDCKLGASLTAEPIEIPPTDILITESTFGRPKYRLPPREQVIEQLIVAVREALARGQTPVIHAYALGKAQEVSKLLTTHGTPVLQHPAIYEISRIYQELGVDFQGSSDADDVANIASYAGRPLAGHAVVTLPKSMHGYRLGGLGDVFSIATTGWAIDAATRYRWGVDLALPLSDHADFDELVELVEQSEATEIICTHGPTEFVDELRERGYNARPMIPASQQRLF